MTKQDDTLPERFSKEALTEGPTCGSVVNIEKMVNEQSKKLVKKESAKFIQRHNKGGVLQLVLERFLIINSTVIGWFLN